ncbi:Vegetative incompatibility protein HET-E-1 [Ceratobasidium theobromae]|uniref:Vegetative incompatibility protein HET-E-1 n=1 Tax=Ceratobasidium theobromae TaxID=1582974 RepID=A0A5N5QIK5_9AGAM|nr:Vegetative incompatibility protein HET-E-1 [Ceratobasidium theobromae]
MESDPPQPPSQKVKKRIKPCHSGSQSPPYAPRSHTPISHTAISRTPTPRPLSPPSPSVPSSSRTANPHKSPPGSLDVSSAPGQLPSDEPTPSTAFLHPPSPVRSPSPEPRNTAWKVLTATLRGLQESAKLIPPFTPIIDGLASFLDNFETVTRHRQEYQQPAEHLNITLQFLHSHLGNSTSPQTTETINDIIKAIQKEVGSIGIQQDQDVPSQVVATTHDEEELLEVSMGMWNTINSAEMGRRLETLKPVELAMYDSILSTKINRRTCTTNTREAILSTLNAWSDNPDAEDIFWLDGMAGTGKTTIAWTLSKSLQSRGQLAASFFCTRTSPECRDATRIFSTIACQLARHSSLFRSALSRTLEENPGAGSLNMSAQFEKLLNGPLLEVKDNVPNNMVVVIDALDECDDSGIIGQMLDTLFRFAANLPIKFFVTSRPEPTIRKRMMSAKDQGARSIFHLHDIEQSLVQANIEVYLHEELASMSPTTDQVNQLAKLAGNLFIYAATAVRYISPGDDTIDSDERFRIMLAIDSKSDKRFKQIDILYSTILGAALNGDDLEPEERSRRQLALWTAVCAQEPIHMKTLAALAGLGSEKQALTALQSLRSVLHISDQDDLVSTLHASFPDYMFNQNRSGDFFCDQTIHSQLVARRFIPDEKVPNLKSRIKENISHELFYACRYWADHLKLAAASDGLQSGLDEFLSERLLFWMGVLNLNRCMVIGVLGLVESQTWLSKAKASRKQVKTLSDAHRFVAQFTAHAICQSTPHIYVSALALSPRSGTVWERYGRRTQGLVAFSPDGTRIVSGSNDWTLLVWNAHDGTIFAGPFEGHTDKVALVAFSPDGTRIASGSHDKMIRVWRVHSGSLTASPFQGHTGAVISVTFLPDVAFSHDGTLIASGSNDWTICVWSAHDGSHFAGPFQGHTNRVRSVAFLPDSTCIVSGSNDGTIHMWSAHGSMLAVFQGHTYAVTAVTFSHDGTRLISSLKDKTIHVWNAHNDAPVISSFQGHNWPVTSVTFSPDGTIFAGPFEGHTSQITSVAFSPDGTRIVSGSCDCTILMWDACNGTHVAGPFIGHTNWVLSVAFLPNSTRIISGSNNKTICMWNAHDGTIFAGPFEGHISLVTSVAFSPDGTRIVSGSYDHTILMWDAHNGMCVTGPFKAHTNWVTSVAFSSDGTQIVSGSRD